MVVIDAQEQLAQEVEEALVPLVHIRYPRDDISTKAQVLCGLWFRDVRAVARFPGDPQPRVQGVTCQSCIQVYQQDTRLLG